MTQQNAQQANGNQVGLKVVLEQMERGVVVGVQAKGCDPVLTVLGGTPLEQALDRVPELLAAARERWAQIPKMPEYQRPPEPKPAAKAPPAQAPTPNAPAKPEQPEVVQNRLM
ncbi:MAG: hypothetical protein Q8P22_09375 [Chloroflexota bacterium]|nr:hypothetical protein [Chloroflexota bacterium]